MAYAAFPSSRPAAAGPIIIQEGQTLLVDAESPRHEEARDCLVRFAELVKTPGTMHTYRITPLSIWNACAAGLGGGAITRFLREFSRYEIPAGFLAGIEDTASRYGRLRLLGEDGRLALEASDHVLAARIGREAALFGLLRKPLSDRSYEVAPGDRGRLKQALVQAGFPAVDLVGYEDGESLPFRLRTGSPAHLPGRPFALRPYQVEAAEAFHAGGGPGGGAGVVCLPCGGGKTVVGIACMAQVQASTLILASSVTGARQWIAELLDKTTLREGDVGEYSGQLKQVRPVTVTTYQTMTYRKSQGADFVHLELFNRRRWGLIIYDEVHLLPAPVFQVTAGLQARRRLGLTATLVREDGREGDVFALIGPKKADIPWKDMERQGWIAKATCREVRVPLPADLRMAYARADARSKFRIAAENPRKAEQAARILARHAGQPALVIGAYLDQIRAIARELGIPVLDGSTPQSARDRIFADFRAGRLRTLAVSKVANFAVDLPEAAVAVQVSGTFGSRQEEAQRLGRILRPKPGANQASFYTLVSRDTVECRFALRRQLFLCEQGYEYEIVESDGAAAD